MKIVFSISFISILTALFLLTLERLFSPPGFSLQTPELLSLIATFFLLSFSISTIIVLFFALFQKMEKNRVMGFAKYLLITLVFFLLFYFLGDQLSQGKWIQTQSWVRFLALAMGLIAGLGASSFLWGFIHVQRSKYQLVGGLYGVLISIGLAYLYSELLGGNYHSVYTYIFGITVLMLVLSFMLLEKLFTKAKFFFVLPTLIALGISIYVHQKNDASVVSHLEANSPTFSNLIVGLNTVVAILPRQDLDLARDVLNAKPTKDQQKEVAHYQLGDKNWNILLIVVDTLRADALFPPSKNTPFFNRFVEESITFQSAHSHASGTYKSMPTIFKSTQPNAPDSTGQKIGPRMVLSNRKTFAVVNEYFLNPQYKRIRDFLIGFDEIDIYREDDQNQLAPLFNARLQKMKHEKWFSWIHFFNMHGPMWGGERLQMSSKKEAYRKAANWLDGEMEKIYENLKVQGLLENTLIVFTSDHGESLALNYFNGHGVTANDEELRIPIIIRIPGFKGKKLKGHIANIDLLPTILDLVKETPDPSLAGNSRVPDILENEEAEYDYYAENMYDTHWAIIRGNDKIFYDSQKGIIRRFDLSKDPYEKKDLFKNNADDHSLLRSLVFRAPERLKDHFQDADNQRLLLEKIKSSESASDLALLAKLAPLYTSTEYVETLTKKVIKVDNKAFSPLFRSMCAFENPMLFSEMQKRLENEKHRLFFLQRISKTSCKQFDPIWLTEMLEQANENEAKEWLHLLEHYDYEGNHFESILVDWLNKDALTQRVLLAIPGMKWASSSGSLKEKVRSLYENEIYFISAIRASSAMKDKLAGPIFCDLLNEKGKQVEQKNLLRGISKVGLKEGNLCIQKKVWPPHLQIYVAKALSILGGKGALNRIQKIQKNHPSPGIRALVEQYKNHLHDLKKSKNK